MKRKFLSAVVMGTVLATSSGVFSSCSNNDDDIKHLQSQIDSNTKTLEEKITALTSALDQAKAEINSAKTAIEAATKAAAEAKAAGNAAAEAQKAAAAAQAAAAQAKADAIAEAQKLAADLKAQVDNKVEQSDYDAKIKEIDGHIDFAKGKIESLEAAQVAINAQIKTLMEFKKLVEDLNLEVEISTINNKISTLTENLETLNNKVTSFIETYKNDKTALDQKLVEVKNELTTLGEQVSSVQNGLSILTNLLSQRLTSLVYAPTNFINGIETIDFATLKYAPWTNLLADKSDGKTMSSINDGKTTAYYYANPSSVLKDDVLKLSVLTQNGTNTITKSSETESFTATLMDIKDGKMTINFKKNIEEPLNKDPEGNKEFFTLAAIKAEIKTTSEEIKNGLSPFVISNWVRLSETSDVPFIHDNQYNLEVQEDLNNNLAPHFYPYTMINDGGKDGISNTQYRFIYKYIPYNEPLNLKDIVEICNHEGKRFEKGDYNLDFEFNLVDYNLRASGEEKTNQKEFAKISNGVITSQARNGEANNRSAIGREPMVQIILRNTINKEVVDVRYLKIQWTGVNSVEDLGMLQQTTDKFDQACCSKVYTTIVGTDTMNDKIYAKLNTSKEEFHRNYWLDSYVYANLEDAKAGISTESNGSISQIPAHGSQTTWNLQWDLPIATNPITMEEYKVGKATRTVYGRYLKGTADQMEFVIFAIQLDLNITKIAFNAGYNQSYWNNGAILSNTNKDKTFQVNPSLTDDAIYGINNYYDSQIIASILKGYNKNEGKLETAIDLVANATTARFVFDESRVTEMLGNGWYVSDGGMTLKRGLETGAMIDGNNIMLHEFYRPTSTEGGNPTETAIALLGQTVPVKLVATICNEGEEIEVEMDHFKVNFINPLELRLANVTDTFKDLLTGGSTIEIKDNAQIFETFGLKRVIWKLGAPVTDELAQWYNVQNVTWDLANAKTNLKKEGNNIIISSDPMASNWKDFADKYLVTASPSVENAKTLTFKNNSGAHIQQTFTISVPVYAKTKWSDKLYDSTKKYVQISITPGDTK